MNLWVVQVLPHVNQENINLFLRPSQAPRERRQSSRLKKKACVLIIPRPELFVFLVLGPAVCRPFESGFNHVGESDLVHDRPEIISLFVRPAQFICCFA